MDLDFAVMPQNLLASSPKHRRTHRFNTGASHSEPPLKVAYLDNLHEFPKDDAWSHDHHQRTRFTLFDADLSDEALASFAEIK
jgi:hypothetical protein